MKLGYHSHLLPLLEIEGTAGKDSEFWCLNRSTIFDCRKIPIAFLDDTGDAVFEEMTELKSRVELPYHNCYFEFADHQAIVVYESSTGYDDQPSGGDVLQAFPFVDWLAPDFEKRVTNPRQVMGCFNNGTKFPAMVRDGQDEDGQDKYRAEYEEGPAPFFSITQHDTSHVPHGMDGEPTDAQAWEKKWDEEIDQDDFHWTDRMREAQVERLARRILAVTSLLSERLLAAEFVPDPAPKLTKARLKRGKLPVTGNTHVLTINVAAVRRVAKPANGTHESPCLHWRRGHPRVLHRGSEFESKTWVKRSLVGDPDRGFMHKDYRLIWSPPMLKPDAAE